MLRNKRLGILFLCFLSLFARAGIAGDVKRETEFADEIIKTQPLGKTVWLEAEGIKFLGLYTETEKKLGKGAVIILHDQGGHPDQLQLVKSLRAFLPEHGWSALSLQMPVREAGAGDEDYFDLFPAALARIQAGVDYLHGQKADPLVLAGYGLGALMALYSQTEKPGAFKALAAISLAVPETQNKTAQTLDFIKAGKIPLLDIYAERDLSAVVKSAADRRLAAKANPDYRQVKIIDEDHLYRHDQGLVVKRIYSWIERVAAGPENSGGTVPAPASQEKAPQQ